MNDYFRNIAIEKLGHSEESPSFFREYSSAKIMLSDSDFLQRLRKAQDRIMISQINGDIRKSGKNTVRENGAVWLLQRIAVMDYEEIDKTRSELETLWHEIAKQIENDIATMQLQIWDFDWHIMPIGRIADNYWGMSILLSWERSFC